jgi:DnaA family protein
MQLTFDIKLRENITFDNFFAGLNEEAVAAMKQMALSTGEQFLYCFGAEGVGRSHLLQACCQLASQSKHSSVYLPLKEFVHMDTQMLEGLESLNLVCLDDIDAIAGRADWEEAVFDLFNRLRDAGSRLIVAAPSSAKELSLSLADLSSRLSWGVAYHLKPLAEKDTPSLLTQWAVQRGFGLSEEVLHFILNRYPRDIKSLQKILLMLDQASLERQQKITIPLIKSVLSPNKE